MTDHHTLYWLSKNLSGHLGLWVLRLEVFLYFNIRIRPKTPCRRRPFPLPSTSRTLPAATSPLGTSHSPSETPNRRCFHLCCSVPRPRQLPVSSAGRSLLPQNHCLSTGTFTATSSATSDFSMAPFTTTYTPPYRPPVVSVVPQSPPLTSEFWKLTTTPLLVI